MDSNEIIETPELKYLWLLKKVVVRSLLLLFNVYEYAKENSGDFKTTIVSAQKIIVSIFVYVDDKFDRYAPSLAKELVTKSQSLIYKTKPLVKKLVTTSQTIITPLITITIFLLETTRYLIQSITPKPAPLSSEDQNPLQKSLNTAQTLLQSAPLAAATQSLLQNTLDATKSLAPGTILQENPVLEAVNSAAQNSGNTTKSLVGGIPLFGNVTQSLTTNPADLVNQIADTTNSLVKGNPVLDAVNSAAQNSLDTANSLVGGIPVVGDVAQSLTNPADLANQILDTTNSLVNDNPLPGAINSAVENTGIKPGARGTKAALQAAYQTLKLAGIPVIAQLWYEFVNQYPTLGEISEFILPLVEAVCVVYNKAVKYMDKKGYSIAGYLPLVPIDEMKAAYKLVKTSGDGLAAVGDLLGIDNNKGLSAVGDILGINKNK